MESTDYYLLNKISVVDVTGVDADAIVHNLTTNEIKTLPVHRGCETFVTEVRGKTIGHVVLFRLADRLRLIGPAGQSEAIAAHVDRYTIREDATPEVRDEAFAAVVVPPGSTILPRDFAIAGDGDEPAPPKLAGELLTHATVQTIEVYETRWLGPSTGLLLVPGSDPDRDHAVPALIGANHATEYRKLSESDFHTARVLAGFPWFGIDIDVSNLPQEADRDSLTLSFTKGCYLGQETVARLDALGQVQKMLVRWKIDGLVPPPETRLMDGEKLVGRLSSVAEDKDGNGIAIGMARRSHFEPGATAVGTVEATGESFTATVI